MGYIKNNNGILEIISCREKEAVKQGLTEEPQGFKPHPIGGKDARFYNNDYTHKSDQELIDEELVEDNRGDYYEKANPLNKVTITRLNEALQNAELFTQDVPKEFEVWNDTKNKWEKDKAKEDEHNINIAYNELARTDIEVPRPLEDIYNVLTQTQKDALPSKVVDKINNKVDKRNEYKTLVQGK